MNANNPSSPAAGTHKDFIVFILDGAHYALPAEAVAEVIDKQPVTPVPFMPLHVEGVVNIGGRALPQLDLRSCLSDQAVGTRDDYELMVVESDGAPCVLAVDRVLSRVEVPAETVREVAEHVRLVQAVDLTYPIILGVDGRVMDGMHRVVRALLEGHPTIAAVQFDVHPAPDFRNCQPDQLPYPDDE